VAVLVAHLTQQRADKLAAGDAWIDSGLVFTELDGRPLHPADVTELFQFLVRQAGLPPIRLHDLRHGAATNMLAAGVDMKIVQAVLRHASITTTSDLYTSVLTTVAREAVWRPRVALLVNESTLWMSGGAVAKVVSMAARPWPASRCAAVPRCAAPPPYSV
jgi:site-specific recombinase XerD